MFGTITECENGKKKKRKKSLNADSRGHCFFDLFFLLFLFECLTKKKKGSPLNEGHADVFDILIYSFYIFNVNMISFEVQSYIYIKKKTTIDNNIQLRSIRI